MYHLKALVTGRAGLVGSQSVDALLKQPNYKITVLDGFFQVTEKELEHRIFAGNPKLNMLKTDLVAENLAELQEFIPESCDDLHHLAANPDVEALSEEPAKRLRENIVAVKEIIDLQKRREIPLPVAHLGTKSYHLSG